MLSTITEKIVLHDSENRILIHKMMTLNLRTMSVEDVQSIKEHELSFLVCLNRFCIIASVVYL